MVKPSLLSDYNELYKRLIQWEWGGGGEGEAVWNQLS